MLKRDKLTFLEFVSVEPSRIEAAVAKLNQLPRGHFEDHPPSSKLIAEHIPALVNLWNENAVVGARSWVIQFIADAKITDARVKPIITAALSSDFEDLPVLLYLIGSQPAASTDIGEQLAKLATHADREVRWRVAWVLSRMPSLNDPMRRALDLLRSDTDNTTRLYVQDCDAR